MEPVELRAGVAEPGHLDDRLRAEVEPRPAPEREQVDAACGDVLAHRAGTDGEAGDRELVVQLAVDQVHLPQVRLRRVARHS